MSYFISPDAYLDLDEIWDDIALDSPDAADHWIGRLFEAFEALGQTPSMGHTRSDLTDFPVLFWPVGRYMVIYLIDREEAVEIVAVSQGSRDIPLLLRRKAH